MFKTSFIKEVKNTLTNLDLHFKFEQVEFKIYKKNIIVKILNNQLDFDPRLRSADIFLLTVKPNIK